MSEIRKRYIAKLKREHWKHWKSKKDCKRTYLFFPEEIADNPLFKLRPDRDVIATLNDDGTITLESL